MKTNLSFEARAGSLYFPNYIKSNLISDIKSELLALDWLTKRTARHEYFMSLDLPRSYSYGNRNLGEETYEAKPFSPLVSRITLLLNMELEANFNVCFLNKYDNELQHLGWHADDFPGMDESEPIAVVSFGAEREIWVKPQDYKGTIPKEWRFSLGDGSLFVMPPGFQSTHFHRIPKHDRPCDWRISLTFRSFK